MNTHLGTSREIFHSDSFIQLSYFLYWNSQKNSLQSHHVPRAQIMVLSKPYCLQTQLSIFPGPAHSPFAFRTTLSSLVYTYSLDLDCQELHDHSASKNKSSGFFFSKISAGCIVDTQKVPQQMLWIVLRLFFSPTTRSSHAFVGQHPQLTTSC